MPITVRLAVARFRQQIEAEDKAVLVTAKNLPTALIASLALSPQKDIISCGTSRWIAKKRGWCRFLRASFKSAMQAAQVKVLSNSRLVNPSYWAAFTLVGDPN